MGAAGRETRTGELLNAVYVLHELLESEPIYDSYRATDRRRARVVKVRLLHPELALQSSVVEGFLRAPKALGGLRHPNLSQVLAVESDETGIPFVVEEHVEGEPLTRMIARFPEGMPLGVAINVLSPVVDALAAVHERGVAHGRLDGDRVILGQLRGTTLPKLTSSGAAVVRRPAGARAVSRAFAPELRDGKSTGDVRSDVWALGALLYETLCGTAPKGCAGAQPRLDERAPHVPAELAAIVERCLAEDPSRRPASASDLRQVLRGVRERMRPSDAKLQPVQPKAPEVTRAVRSAPPRKPVGRSIPVAREEVAPRASGQPRAAVSARAEPADSARTVPDLALALSATLIAQPAAASPAPAREPAAPAREPVAPAREPAAPAREPRRPPARAESRELIEFPCADDAADLEPEPAAKAEPAAAAVQAEDEPEIVLEAAPASRAPASAATAGASHTPAQPSIEVKTLSDVAAAFASIENGPQHAQAEAGSTRSASGRASSASVATVRGGARDQAGKRDGAKDKRQQPLSPRQLREANAAPARGPTAEQLRVLREKAQRRERRVMRTLGALLFLLFAFTLLFAIPLLCDPTRSKAQALFGGRTQIVVAVFTIVSVFALVRTWALQIEARPMLLRPVTITLKVVTGTVCVLGASFFLPAGALGPAEVGARAILPWGGSFFYLFLAIYGLARGVREVSSNALAGITLALLYTGGFFGSYRVLATTVLAKQPPSAAQDVRALRDRGRLADVGKLADVTTHDVAAADAGTGDGMFERAEVGASEQEDMRAIERMSETRKGTGTRLESLGKQVGKLMD